MLRSDPDPPQALSLDDLRGVIELALRNRTFLLKGHGHARSKQRQISVLDIQHVCQIGQYRKAPRWENGNWKYELSGLDLDGTETTVVLAVESFSCRVTVVTVF